MSVQTQDLEKMFISLKGKSSNDTDEDTKTRQHFTNDTEIKSSLANTAIKVMNTFDDVLSRIKKEPSHLLNNYITDNKLHICKSPTNGIYSAETIVDVFTRVSSDPVIITQPSRDLLNINKFTNKIDLLTNNATNKLNELKVNPYVRMAGKFHINNVNTLKTDLVTRIHNVYANNVANNNGALNDLHINQKIKFKAEMNIIELMAKNLKIFINKIN